MSKLKPLTKSQKAFISRYFKLGYSRNKIHKEFQARGKAPKITKIQKYINEIRNQRVSYHGEKQTIQQVHRSNLVTHSENITRRALKRKELFNNRVGIPKARFYGILIRRYVRARTSPRTGHTFEEGTYRNMYAITNKGEMDIFLDDKEELARTNHLIDSFYYDFQKEEKVSESFVSGNI